MGTFEVWEISRAEVCVYTEEKSVAREMRKDFGRGARYVRRGAEIGWHFVVPKRTVPLLERRYEKTEIVEEQKPKKSPVDFQELTATIEPSFDSEATN